MSKMTPTEGAKLVGPPVSETPCRRCTTSFGKNLAGAPSGWICRDMLTSSQRRRLRERFRDGVTFCPGPRNTNCLEGLACPQCGNDERLFIVGMSVFEVVDDGTLEHESVEWDDSSHTRCPQCNHEGNLCEFREEQEPPEEVVS